MIHNKLIRRIILAITKYFHIFLYNLIFNIMLKIYRDVEFNNIVVQCTVYSVHV